MNNALYSQCGMVGDGEEYAERIRNLKFIKNSGCQPITYKCNFVILARNDGTGTFLQNNPVHQAIIQDQIAGVNQILSNIENPQSCVYNISYPYDSGVRIDVDVHYINNYDAYSYYEGGGTACPGTNLWPPLQSVVTSFNNSHPTEINIYFIDRGPEIQYLEDVMASGAQITAPWPNYLQNLPSFQGCSDFPKSFNSSYIPYIIVDHFYLEYIRRMYFHPLYYPNFRDTSAATVTGWHLRSFTAMLTHELGHMILSKGHEETCNNIMRPRGIGLHLTESQLETIFRVASTTNLHKFIDCNNSCQGFDVITNNAICEISSDMYVFGDLRVKEGHTLSINAKVKFSPKSKLIVEKGGNLVLGTGCILTNGCGNQWQGVIVEGNGSNQSGAGKVTMSNNAIIEYAKDGISMDPTHIPWPALSNSWGGLVQANNSIIRNCNRAVAFMQMDDDDSYFSGCTFTNILNDGVTLWDNDNVSFNSCTFSSIGKSAILAFDSRINATNNTISGAIDGIEVASVTGTPYGSRISNNAINTTRDGIYAMAQTSASELQMESNHIFSNSSGVTLEGMSIYRLSHNNFVGSQFASKFWATSSGNSYDYVHNNTFSSADWGNLANYENTPEFNDNCYGFNGKDLEVNSGSIYETQGDAGFAAGNCFSKGNTPAITIVNSTPFDYYIVPVKEPTCRTPQDYLNPIGYNIESASSERQSDCTPSTNIIYRKCLVPKTKIEGDKMVADLLAEIKKVEDHPTMSPELKKYLINRYKACIKKIKQDIIIIILEDDGTIGKTQARKDAAAFAKGTDDLSLQTIGIGILLKGSLYQEAQSYLNTFPTSGGVDAIDFVQTQAINMDYVLNKGIYQLTESDRSKLMVLGNKTTPVSGFARSLYYKLTGDKLPITFIHSTPIVVPRSITKGANQTITSYPNPVEGDVYHLGIADRAIDAVYQVKIYNVQGNLLHEAVLKSNGDHSLDISSLSTGMYILNVQSEGINVYNTKFVKIN